LETTRLDHPCKVASPSANRSLDVNALRGLTKGTARDVAWKQDQSTPTGRTTHILPSQWASGMPSVSRQAALITESRTELSSLV